MISIAPLPESTEAELISNPSLLSVPEPAVPVIDIFPSVVSRAAPETIFIPSLLASTAFSALPSRVIFPVPEVAIREPVPSNTMPSLLDVPALLPSPVRVILPPPLDSIVLPDDI